MQYTIFWRVIKVREIDKIISSSYWNGISSIITIALKRRYIFGFSSTHNFLMFIITFCIILSLNQVHTMTYAHKRLNVFCNGDLSKTYNLFSRIQASPNIFLGKVIKKIPIPDKNENWKLIALVRVVEVLRDIYEPKILINNSLVWVGPISNILEDPCVSVVKNQSLNFFYATRLGNSSTSFQLLYKPVKHTKNEYLRFRENINKSVENLSIKHIGPRVIEAHGSISVLCIVSGYPTPIFYWYKNNDQPISSNLQKRVRYTYNELHSTITITSVVREDAGNYTCYAENIYGYTKTSFTLKVVETEDSRRDCKGIRKYCLHGRCVNNACLCDPDYRGRRCHTRNIF